MLVCGEFPALLLVEVIVDLDQYRERRDRDICEAERVPMGQVPDYEGGIRR